MPADPTPAMASCRRRHSADGGASGPLDSLRAELGFVLPTAISMLAIIATIAGGAATAALTANGQSNRDGGVKRAVAAADAGLDVAIYRVNKLNPRPYECVVVDAGGNLRRVLARAGWCPAQTESLGDGARFSYATSIARRVSINGQVLLQRRVVATGLVSGGVRRRALATIGSSTGGPLFAGNAVTSLDDLLLRNNSTIVGDAASNGNITLTNNARICGRAAPGPGKRLITHHRGRQCPGFSSTAATQRLVLNPVDQGNAPAANDNDRIGPYDRWTSLGRILWDRYYRVLRIWYKRFGWYHGRRILRWWSHGAVWDREHRVLKVRNNATLTLMGNVYSFCRLEVSNNARLIIGVRNPARPLKIYIDAPENCPGVHRAGSVEVRNNGSIMNVNSSPATVLLYVAGSSTRLTRVDFTNNVSFRASLAIYAPQSTVRVRNNARVVGAVAARQVELANNSRVFWHHRVASIVGGDVLPLYRRQSWTECAAGKQGPAPDSGCRPWGLTGTRPPPFPADRSRQGPGRESRPPGGSMAGVPRRQADVDPAGRIP